MGMETYSLKELAARTGIEARTIRSYIAKGLLRGPMSRGRNASYSEYHLHRLREIQALKAQGLSLEEIRLSFLHARPGQKGYFGAPTTRGMQPKSEAIPDPDPESTPVSWSMGSLRRLLRKGKDPRFDDAVLGIIGDGGPRFEGEVLPDEADSKTPLEATQERGFLDGVTEDAPLPRLLRILQGAVHNRAAHRRSRTELWTQVEVTPEIQLHVRGELSERERELVRQIAEHLRDILLGEDDAAR